MKDLENSHLLDEIRIDNNVDINVTLEKIDINLIQYFSELENRENYILDLDNGIYPEFLMSWISPEGLHVAGQADLVCKSGNDIDILDWKTNKEIKRRSFYNSSKKSNVKLKYPLNSLEDCNYNIYMLYLY